MTDKINQTNKPETLNEDALDAAAGGWNLINAWVKGVKHDPEVTRLGGQEQLPN